MIALHNSARIFICTIPIDMRRSFDGLCGCVEQVFKDDPLSGNMYVFFNRKCTMVKILLWDRSGFWIFAKRLESGRYSLSSIKDNCEIDIAELMCILEGIDLHKSSRRKRFSL